MKSLINIKIKYISIIIGLLGIIPYLLPLIERYDFVKFNNIEIINLTIWYGITILCFLSGIYWGISLNAFNINKINMNYLLPALSLIPFSFALGTILVSDFLNIIFLVIGFLISQILDEILFAFKYYFNWYIKLRRFLTVVVVTLMIYYYSVYSNV